MNLSSKKILFLAPRVHTNQLELLNHLNGSCKLVFMSVKNPLDNNKYSINNYEKHISSSILNQLNFFQDFPIYSTYFVPNVFRFIKQIISFSPNSVIVRNSSPIICVFLLLLLKPVINFKLIYYSQTPIFKKNISKSLYKKVFFSFFNKRISPVLCKPFSSNFKEKYFRENIEYIPFVKNINIPNKRKIKKPTTILCVGKYETRKNLEIVINSIIDLNNQGNEINLIIVGGADTPERLTYRNNLIENFKHEFIKFHTNVPFEKMNKFYLDSDIFLLVSKNETASVSQLEAMSYGLPVIISKDNGTASYCVGCGFIINPTKNEIKNSIIKLIKDDLFYEKLSLNAIKKVGQYHDVKSISNKFISL